MRLPLVLFRPSVLASAAAHAVLVAAAWSALEDRPAEAPPRAAGFRYDALPAVEVARAPDAADPEPPADAPVSPRSAEEVTVEAPEAAADPSLQEFPAAEPRSEPSAL